MCSVRATSGNPNFRCAVHTHSPGAPEKAPATGVGAAHLPHRRAFLRAGTRARSARPPSPPPLPTLSVAAASATLGHTRAPASAPSSRVLRSSEWPAGAAGRAAAATARRRPVWHAAVGDDAQPSARPAVCRPAVRGARVRRRAGLLSRSGGAGVPVHADGGDCADGAGHGCAP
eukprot:5193263-Prymnesium_polylepis.1